MQIISAMAQPVQWIWVLNFTFFLLFHMAIVFGETCLPTMANAAQDVFFSKDLSLVRTGNIGREDYKDVIVFLRQRLLGKRYFDDNPKSPLAHTWYSHNLPVLRPEINTDPVPWFDVVVQTPKNRVTFKLRRDNLYVVGFQVHRTTGDDQWREFQRKDKNVTLPSLIPGSNRLPFGGSYLEMERYGNITLGKTKIGQEKLIDAVDGLVPVNTTDAVRARSLLVVIFMISESTRFRYVSDFIAKNYLAISSVEIGSDTVQDLPELVKIWDKLSPALLRVDAGMDFYIEESTYDRIKKEQQAVAVLGILKYSNYRKNSNDATAATLTLPVQLSTA